MFFQDKNRSRLLTIKLDGEDTSPVLLAIFIDNVRDEGYKTTSISFRAAMTDGSRKELHSQMIESVRQYRFCDHRIALELLWLAELLHSRNNTHPNPTERAEQCPACETAADTGIRTQGCC